MADTARRWAARLIDAAGGRPRRVAIFAYRSEVSYIGVLAALFAGAAFVPLNRKFPIERTRAMLEQADVDALIVDNDSLPQLHEVLRGMRGQPALLLACDRCERIADRRFPGTVFDRRDLARDCAARGIAGGRRPTIWPTCFSPPAAPAFRAACRSRTATCAPSST